VTDTDRAVVCCVDVARTFGSGRAAVVAVHDATCAIMPGEHVALVGPSGSGKSTLLHLMAGLDVPTRGQVTWPTIGERDQLRPLQVGVVFQAPSLIPALDVLENVAFPLVLQGADPASANDQALDALQRLHLEELAVKIPDELSGGQAQRVAVARVLAARPRLVLADEPTGQLDHATAAGVIDALLEAADHTGAALVVSTHDAAIATRFPTRWTMDDGRLDAAESAPCSA
jgi:putative ABC transport system ATP-binding protein